MPRATLTLEPRPESVGLARQFLRDRYSPPHDARVVDVAVLLVSELVTNTVRYGGPPVTVQLDCDEEHALHVRVSDAGAGTPRPTRATVDDERGRGLQIVQLLSDDWGVDRRDGGKTVWFTLNPTAG